MKNHLLAVSIFSLALAVAWHAETGKYQIFGIGGPDVYTSAGSTVDHARFVKFNTRTGKAEEYCWLYKGYCQKWEQYRQGEDQRRKNEPSMEELIEKRVKELGRAE